MMEFVCNANFKGQYHKSINLRKLHEHVPNSKLHMTPYQLVIKDLKGTLIFFSTGRFRIMGCIDELEASFLPFAYLQKLEKHPLTKFPAVTVQSYTLKYNLGFYIHLLKMSDALMIAEVPFACDFELFPAIRLKEFKPVSVNVFNTGKVMICGLRNPDDIYSIIPRLKELCEPYKMV